MYRILVAIDGSDHSRHAVAYAARRASDAPCCIDLLHVEKPVMAWEVGAVSSIENVTGMRAAESDKLLVAAASQFGPSTEVVRHAVSGDPARTILEQAAARGVDEIVIGSRGLRPLGAAMIGSVAYRVVHDANVAVVVVR